MPHICSPTHRPLQRGRVSIADLAVESNRLIDLAPKDLPTSSV